MISDNCATMNVLRSSNHCKRRWETLLSDYNKIRAWEINSAPVSGSYWTLQPAKMKHFCLPASFDQEVYGSMDAIIKAQEARAASAAADTDTDSEDLTGMPKEGKDDSSEDYEDVLDSDASDSDYLIGFPVAKGRAEEVIGMLEAEMAAADADSGSEETGTKTMRSTNKEREIANKLKANAEQIHAILRGEIPDNVMQGHGLVDLTKPNAIEIEFTRRQADELIKSFGVLVSTLDQFNNLIRDGEFEGINLMDSMTL